MTHFDDMTRKFRNHRQWRVFIAAVHESVAYPRALTYPMVVGALRSGRAWFEDTAAVSRDLKSCGCAVRP